MQYALLIYGTAADEEDFSPETMDGYNAFTNHVRDRGVLKAGEALHPVATATTVRIRDGRTVTTDGPFAETKELLGGFYIVEAPNLDGALDWAGKVSLAIQSPIEVRPFADEPPR